MKSTYKNLEICILIVLLVREGAWTGHLIFSLTCSVCGQNIALPDSPSVGTILMTLLKGEEKLNGKRHKNLSLLKPGNGNSKIQVRERREIRQKTNKRKKSPLIVQKAFQN